MFYFVRLIFKYLSRYQKLSQLRLLKPLHPAGLDALAQSPRSTHGDDNDDEERVPAAANCPPTHSYYSPECCTPNYIHIYMQAVYMQAVSEAGVCLHSFEENSSKFSAYETTGNNIDQAALELGMLLP